MPICRVKVHHYLAVINYFETANCAHMFLFEFDLIKECIDRKKVHYWIACLKFALEYLYDRRDPD